MKGWVIQITADLYGQLFRETSTAAMRRLDAAMTATRAATAEPPAEPVPAKASDDELHRSDRHH